MLRKLVLSQRKVAEGGPHFHMRPAEKHQSNDIHQGSYSSSHVLLPCESKPNNSRLQPPKSQHQCIQLRRLLCACLMPVPLSSCVRRAAEGPFTSRTRVRVPAFEF